jgi:hypothetical protein
MFMVEKYAKQESSSVYSLTLMMGGGYIPLKWQLTSTRPHGVISQKTELFRYPIKHLTNLEILQEHVAM